MYAQETCAAPKKMFLVMRHKILNLKADHRQHGFFSFQEKKKIFVEMGGINGVWGFYNSRSDISFIVNIRSR